MTFRFNPEVSVAAADFVAARLQDSSVFSRAGDGAMYVKVTEVLVERTSASTIRIVLRGPFGESSLDGDVVALTVGDTLHVRLDDPILMRVKLER